jgi:drug/metabolite transporter (DMT)-like permease
MNNVKISIQMVFATILFAGAFIAGKLGSADFSPVMLTFLRIGLATVILFPIMLLSEKENWKPNRHEFLLAIKLGIIGMIFYHLFFFTALKYTTVTNASVINATMPIITAMLAFIFLKEQISALKILYIFIAFTGVILTITQWNLKSLVELTFNKGDLIMLCGTLSWAIYGIIIKREIQNTSALKMTAFTLLACTLIISPFAISEMRTTNLLSMPLSSYYSIIYMAIFPTVIGYTIQQNTIKKLGASTASLFINLVPIFSIVLSVIILKEPILPLNYISGGMIIFSVYRFAKTS